MHAEELEQLKEQYAGFDMLTVYIAEAHAADEWTLKTSTNGGDESRWDVMLGWTLDERRKLAQDWVEWLKPTTPYVVDKMDDATRLAYGAWPERLVIVEDGKIVYYGEQGPWGYKPEEVAA